MSSKITYFGAGSAWTVYEGRTTVSRHKSELGAKRAANKLRKARDEARKA